MAEALVRKWIVSIIQQRPDVLRAALRQRAKFEGWLKFELVTHMEQQGIEDVKVEENSFEKGDGHSRSDIAFSLSGTRYYVELKTSNTSWKVLGTPHISRPTTTNIEAIISDGETLRNCKGQGIIAFVLFPVPRNNKWEKLLTRIASGLSLSLSVQEHTSTIAVPVDDGRTADVVVCCFEIPKTAPGSCEATDSEAASLEVQEQLILRLP